MFMHPPPVKYLIKKIENKRNAPSPKEDYFKDQSGRHCVVKQTRQDVSCPTVRELDELFERLGGLKRIIKPGERVFIKINLSSPHPIPTTTDPNLTSNLVYLIKEYGAATVDVGDFGGPFWLPSINIVNKIGMETALSGVGGKMVYFDEGPWTEVNLESDILPPLAYPSMLYEYDRIIYLANLKTHFIADFTCSLKLTMGLLHLRDRFWHLHTRMKIKEGIADINKAVYPDLVLIDGRKAFIEGGPVWGKIVRPKILLASGNRVALDYAAIDVLREYPTQKNPLTDTSPERHPTLLRAVKIGLGDRGVII